MCSILVCSQSFLEIEFFFSSLLYHIKKKKKKRYRIEVFVKIFVIVIATPSVSIIVSIKNNKK